MRNAKPKRNTMKELHKYEAAFGIPLDEHYKKAKYHERDERIGDWVCIICKNLNFSFRNKCNRCQASKDDIHSKVKKVGISKQSIIKKVVQLDQHHSISTSYYTKNTQQSNQHLNESQHTSDYQYFGSI